MFILRRVWVMLHHRDDSRTWDFYMLLYLYEYFLLARRTGRQDWRAGGQLEVCRQKSLNLGHYTRPKTLEGNSATKPCAANSSCPISSRERY